jgi:hypothetical protein
MNLLIEGRFFNRDPFGLRPSDDDDKVSVEPAASHTTEES